MKNCLILVALSFLSLSSNASIKECENMMKSYACSYEGSSMELVLKKVSDTNFAFTLDGQGTEYQVDGKEHKSKLDDSMEIATCSSAGLVVTATFKGQSENISFLKTEQGLNYVVGKKQGQIVLPCTSK